MKTITLVTGNKGKLTEWQRLIPENVKLLSVDVDLEEIQSLDLKEIVKDKAKRAYAIVNKPVIVEDISAGLDKLQGMPGPFIKFFELAMGMDALFQLAGKAGDPATVKCAVAYYDGSRMLVIDSEVKGTVHPSLGENGFGFDKVFMPNGQAKTYGQMNAEEKDSVSHRSIAIKKLALELRQL